MRLRGRRTKHINFPFRESAQTPPTKQNSAVSTPLFKNKDFFLCFIFNPQSKKNKKKNFHALFPSLKILSSLFFSGEIQVTGPPPLVAPPPSRFQPDHKDLSTIRPEEPTSTKSTPKIVNKLLF
ncbi:hypothetical protein V6Z11_D13G266200 [Gossypium hirsutum]